MADLTTEINLLNGSGQFDPWFNTLLPDVGACPSGVPCSCPGLEPLADEEGEGDGASALATALVLYLTYVDLGDPRQATAFPEIVQGLVDLAHRAPSDDERHEVACALLDPNLVFISSEVEEIVPGLVAGMDQ